MTHLHTAQQRLELKLDNIEATYIARLAQTEVRASRRSQTDNGTPIPYTVGTTSSVRFSMSSFYWQCENSCICACHYRQTWRTPRLLSRFLGILFVGYAGIPYITASCDTHECTRRSNPTTLVTYLFPPWFLARIFILAANFSPMCGLEVNIRIPRIMSSSSRIFEFCATGNVEGVKALFLQGLSSPFDVDLSGQTLLHVRRS